jgi:predicted DNA-binding antitoxin AbrB/MazE fold protein
MIRQIAWIGYNSGEVAMNKQIEAVYENGMFRPVKPINLRNGERLDLILIRREPPQPSNGDAAELLADIAALPLEGATDAFSGEQHDQILYPPRQ